MTERENILVADLLNATRTRDACTQHTLSRRLAATAIGPKRRWYNAVPSANPSREQWLHTLSKHGHEGGMLAQVVDPMERELAETQHAIDIGEIEARPLSPDLTCRI